MNSLSSSHFHTNVQQATMSIDDEGMGLDAYSLAIGHQGRQPDGDPQDDTLASAPVSFLHGIGCVSGSILTGLADVLSHVVPFSWSTGIVE
jgi:hypothetical protein